MHRIAIIYPSQYLARVPSLVSMITAFAENGYEIDVFECSEKMPSFLYSLSNVRMCVLKRKSKLNFMLNWMPRIIIETIKRKYSILIGVDPWGLILAGIASKLFCIRYIYFSLEIYYVNDSYHITSIYIKYFSIFKKIESYFNASAAFTIIQDRDRARLLKLENKLNRQHNTFFLPNASNGETKRTKAEYLRHKYHIKDGKFIVLYTASSLSLVETLPIETAQSAHSWDSKYVLIFHSGAKIDFTNPYIIKLLEEIDGLRIFLDNTSLPEPEYNELVSSADIGFAFYNPCDKNVYNMGLSSGKIAKYLQCGLPIITSDLPSLRKIIYKYKCGEVISDISKMETALDKICADYKQYSRNATRCFDELFNFRKNFNNIINQINILLI